MAMNVKYGDRAKNRHHLVTMDQNGNLVRDAPRKRYIPVTKWNEYHDWPTLGGLRHLIFQAKHGKVNGFDKVVKRAGRRVLIDETAFFKWVEGALE